MQWRVGGWGLLLLLLGHGLAVAGSYTLTYGAAADALLLLMTTQENADRAARGEASTRFCTDAPETCTTPDPQAFLEWFVGTQLTSFNAERRRQKALRIRQYCEATPQDIRCQAFTEFD